MSLGFGFSLPALVPYGAGGNNPFNQTGPTLDLSFMGNAGNLSGADTYTLDTNFITPQYQVAAQYAVWVDGSGMTQRNFADIVTFTRGSAATQFDSTGTLIYAPMNAIRNNTMVGAVAGTPGTLPTNWQSFVSGTAAVAVVGSGTESGINYVDITFSGGNTDSISFFIDGTLGHAALNGQTWTGSAYYRLMAGAFTNCTALQAIYEATGAGAALANSNISIASVTGAALSTQRVSITRTNNNASTALEQLTLQITGTGLFSFTLRIGMPQLELGSAATAVNATTGTAYYGPRFDFNPSTLAAQGLLIEEQRTNSIRNSTMQGAVAGTPGTPPTNWSFSTGGATTIQLVGTGTENGITYIEYRFQGTGAADTWNLIYDSSVVAANGQAWTGSIYLKLAGGSTANLPFIQRLVFRDSGFANIQQLDSSALTPTGAGLSTQRNTLSLTATQAATAFVTLQLNSGTPTGAYNITLRIGLPQLELGAFATSVIPTTTTALTRSADVASVNTLAPWFNSVAGTLFAEAQYPFAAASGLNSGFAELDDGTFNEAIAAYVTSGGNATWVVRDGNVNQAQVVVAGMTANTVIKIAGAYALNDFQQATNGALGTADTSGTLPTVNRLALGDIAVGQKLNGYLRRISYFPRRLANADLQTITT